MSAHKIGNAVLTAVKGLLQPYYPDLTTEQLITSLDQTTNTPHKAPIEKPYTIKQAAELLDVSIFTVIRLLNKGTLTRIRLGSDKGRVRIPAHEVRALLKMEV